MLLFFYSVHFFLSLSTLTHSNSQDVFWCVYAYIHYVINCYNYYINKQTKKVLATLKKLHS